METVQSAWNAFLDLANSVLHMLVVRLADAWESLMQSPHHIRLYLAIAAVFVFLLLVGRALFGGGRRPLTLSLDDSSRDGSPRRRASFNQSDMPPMRHGAITPAWASITPIDRTPAARCTHCDQPLPSGSSFCEACGYAQPTRQTGTGR